MAGFPDYLWTRIEWVTIFVVTCHVLGEYVLTPWDIRCRKASNYYILSIHNLIYILPFGLLMGVDYRLLILYFTHLAIEWNRKKFKLVEEHTVCCLAAVCIYLIPVIWFYYLN